MKYLPSNVRVQANDPVRGPGYVVTMPNGREEWHRLAWQATARAHGWTPPESRAAPIAGGHGKACPKVAHVGDGYLHTADDDRPYDVDGVAYCGRCHGWLGAVD